MPPQPDTSRTAQLISLCLWVEAALVPLLFLSLAAHSAWELVQPLERPGLGGAETPLELTAELLRQLFQPSERSEGASPSVLVASLLHNFARPVLLITFDLLCAFLIAFRTRLQYRPRELREVLIPLCGTFCMALLPLSVHLPDWLSARPSLPAAGSQILLLVGIGLALAGQLLALYGIAHLRRNFAIFVEVRDVVLTGPYRHVRHPLYSGEIAMAAGAVLMFPSAVGVAAVAALVFFQQLRARMEEAALGRASAEYARRIAQTGAFLPRWTGDDAESLAPVPASRPLRAALGALAIGVVLANTWTMLRGYEGVPPRASQPLRTHVYDAFMVYHLFTGYSTTNSEAEVYGRRPGTDWTPIDVGELLPYRRGYVTLRLRTWRHEHLGDAEAARAFLAAKLREAYNRLHPEQPVEAVAFGLWHWPSSPAGFRAEREPRKARFEPWFAERAPE